MGPSNYNGLAKLKSPVWPARYQNHFRFICEPGIVAVMCGIAGFFRGDWTSADAVASSLKCMAASIRHRGPDRSDIWFDREAQIGFAHTRLSIVDLSAA